MFLSQRGICVVRQSNEIRIEPLTGLWSAGRGVLARAVRIEPRCAGIRGSVGFTRRLDPDIRVEPDLWARGGWLAETSAVHVAPSSPIVTNPALAIATRIDEKALAGDSHRRQRRCEVLDVRRFVVARIAL